MLSVLHVMTRMAPSGTELQLAGTLRAARERGYWDPTLCVLFPGFPLTQRIREQGVEVLELDGTSRLHVDRFRALRALARSGRYDVVHTSLWGAGAFGRAALAGPRRPAVVMSERRVEDFRGRPRRALDLALARVTDEWIGNSDDVGAFVTTAHHAPAARVHVVRNGVDTQVFRPATGRVTPAVPRIGGLGRLVHQKGFDVLLEALPAVLAQREVEVTIAGAGELADELAHRAAGLPVEFLGALDGSDAVADYLRGLDVFVMASRYEGLPNAVLEAAACGVPVVATDVAGMREAVGPDVPLVPAEDAPLLAAAILAALDRRGAAGPQPAPALTRSFDDVAREHLEVFSAAIRRR